mmetsp:Transcript_5606/g.12943  ORF Transcript_5606/g.12943 Transcript_5606/m.12943 type:complete len:248 (+) Transcript_5606:409-1152(+)
MRVHGAREQPQGRLAAGARQPALRRAAVWDRGRGVVSRQARMEAVWQQRGLGRAGDPDRLQGDSFQEGVWGRRVEGPRGGGRRDGAWGPVHGQCPRQGHVGVRAAAGGENIGEGSAQGLRVQGRAGGVPLAGHRRQASGQVEQPHGDGGQAARGGATSCVWPSAGQRCAGDPGSAAVQVCLLCSSIQGSRGVRGGVVGGLAGGHALSVWVRAPLSSTSVCGGERGGRERRTCAAHGIRDWGEGGVAA